MKRILLSTTAATLVFIASSAGAQTIFDTFDNDVEDVRNASFGEETFSQHLADDYRDFAIFEADESFDWIDAEYFAQKAKDSADGKLVEPERPGEWGIESERRLRELQRAREALVFVLNGGARDAAPAEAAFAQAKYDCWIEQQEEGWQSEHIAACRSQFFTALWHLRAALGSSHPELVERLYFDFDEFDLTSEARGKLDDLAKELKARGLTEVVIVGHADRAGTAKYNLALSRTRAKTVANALRARGITDAKVDFDLIAQGEKQPIVKTGDDVASDLNRRVTVYANEPDIVLSFPTN